MRKADREHPSSDQIRCVFKRKNNSLQLSGIIGRHDGLELNGHHYPEAIAMQLPRSNGLSSVEGHPGSAAMSPFRLKRAIDFIERNLEEPLRLEDIAAAAGLSPPHFGRCFKRDTGYTPYRYVMMRRIDLSKRLILSTELSFIQVALASGFGSQPSFNASFRKIVGTSPGKWKQRTLQACPSRSVLVAG